MFATLHRALAPLSLAALLSACAAVAPGDHYVAPAAGMSFTSAYRDSGSFGTGKSEVLAPDGKMAISWEPATVWDFPLTVGKSWTKQYKATFRAQNREVPFETKQVVEAYEDVVVPAGTFKAFRVRSSDTLGNENVHWFAPEVGIFVKTSLRRTDKNALGTGTRETELQTLKRSSN